MKNIKEEISNIIGKSELEYTASKVIDDESYLEMRDELIESLTILFEHRMEIIKLKITSNKNGLNK